MDWRTFSYLREGTARQQRAHHELIETGIFETLGPFDAALVSTVCVGVDIAGSDLDIICDVTGRDDFLATVEEAHGARPQFQARHLKGGEIVIEFCTETFPIEIFGCAQPVERQYAWRHLSIMKRLIDTEPNLRDKVKTLKRAGFRTEEAFAHLLELSGNPYDAVLSLEEATEEQLVGLCKRAA